MSKKKILEMCVLGLVSLPVWSQRNLDLRDCMEYALLHSSEKEIQKADYDDALIQRRASILETFTPSISASTNAYTNFGRTIDPETNSYISTTSFSNGYSVHAGITLFNGFTALNNIKIAKTAVKMGLSREQQINDKICLSVMQAYFNVIFQTEMQSVLQAQVRTAHLHLDLIAKQYELGQKGYADVVQKEADLSDYEFQMVKIDNERNQALLDLKALMLWPINDTLCLDPTVGRTSPIQPPVIGHVRTAQMIAHAQTFLPSAMLAKGEMEKAKYQVRSARGRFVPTLSLNGGWSTSYYTYPGRADYKAPSFSSQFQNNGGEYVQLSLSFPLYDCLARQSNLQRKKNEYKRAAAVYRQTLKDIEGEVIRAVQDQEGARSAFLQAEKRLLVQTEAYRLNERKFAQGIISSVEFQMVSNAYLNAQAERLNALLQYRLKQSVVKFYEGNSYLDQQK